MIDVELPLAAPTPVERAALVSITLDGAPIDFHGVLADLTIRVGRTGFYDARQPNTAQLTFLGVTKAYTRPFQLGAVLNVRGYQLNLTPAQWFDKFTGRLTDAELDGDRLTVIAVSDMRRFSGYTVGTVAYPEEPWAARVGRIITEAGIAANANLPVAPAGGFNPVLLARDAAPVAFDQYLDELAAMMPCAVYDGLSGKLNVAPVPWRVKTTNNVFRPEDVAYLPVWEMHLPSANIVTVRYGSPEASVTVSDAPSVDRYGPLPAEVKTAFRDAADAQRVATQTLARDAWAHWIMPSATFVALLRMPFVQMANFPALPAPAPFSPWSPYVEGWTERAVSDGEELVWTVEAALSDPLASGLTLAWADVPAGDLWNTINQVTLWRDALTLSDLAP